MREDSSPRIGCDGRRHEEVKQPQQVNIYRADAIVHIVVRRENVFEDGHAPVYALGLADVPTFASA